MLTRRARATLSNQANVMLCIACLAATLASACSTLRSIRGEPTPNQEEAVKAEDSYYTGEAGVKLYERPSFSASAGATLPRHQKVYRSKLERGFAFVKVAGSEQSGWVDNAKLI